MASALDVYGYEPIVLAMGGAGIRPEALRGDQTLPSRAEFRSQK